MDYEKYKEDYQLILYSPRIKEEEIFVRFDEYTKLNKRILGQRRNVQRRRNQFNVM